MTKISKTKVNNMYVKFKTKQTLAQGEECYVFVALTKEPSIICVYQADEYVIR